MCGDGDITIKLADNGLIIDSYVPGGEHGPGKHKKTVATNRNVAHVAKLLGPHLGRLGKKERGRKGGKGKAAAKSVD
jgi:hypothetical protein